MKNKQSVFLKSVAYLISFFNSIKILFVFFLVFNIANCAYYDDQFLKMSGGTIEEKKKAVLANYGIAAVAGNCKIQLSWKSSLFKNYKIDHYIVNWENKKDNTINTAIVGKNALSYTILGLYGFMKVYSIQLLAISTKKEKLESIKIPVVLTTKDTVFPSGISED